MLTTVLHPDYVSRLWLETRHDWARRYLESWRTGLELRKPFPGFHPGIYRDHYPELKGDPTIAFLNAGRPEGPWLTEVISEGDSDRGGNRVIVNGACDRERANEKPQVVRAALHLHLHYPEQADFLIRALGKARQKPDLFISVTSEEGGVRVERMLEK